MKLDDVERGKLSMDSFIGDMEKAVKEWCKIIDEDSPKLESFRRLCFSFF